MNSTDWRRRYAEYRAAWVAHEQAQDYLDQLQARLAACDTDEEAAAVNEGVAVAKRRLSLATKTLSAATSAFAEGRSVLEAIWSAPDDI